MKDIVERCNAAAKHGKNDWHGFEVPVVLVDAADEIELLRARRPVVCGTCGGSAALGNSTQGHVDCPDCGNDGCGPGVRWKE